MWKAELVKNKVYALIIIAIGVIPALLELDATFTIIALMLGACLFFAKENMIW